MTAGCLHVMFHALDAKRNKLPNNLEVSVTYADLKRGSKSIPIILRNMTVTNITIYKGEKIVRVQIANKMSQWNLCPGTLEVLDREQGIERMPLCHYHYAWLGTHRSVMDMHAP